MSKVSVIIPCYNSEKTILYTLRSLEEQTYKDFKIIVVNDGSSDGTANLIKKYIKESKINITLENIPNSGVSVARNKGIEISNSDYIAFVDSDDKCHPEFLERLVFGIECGNGKDVAFCKYFTSKRLDEKFVALTNEKKEDVSKRELLELYTHHRKESLCFCGFLFRKKIIDDYNIKFSPIYHYGEDTLFLFKYLKHCLKGGCYIKDSMYAYYMREESATHAVKYNITENIYACMDCVDYWKNDPAYDIKWGEYFVSRAIWSVAKTFASSDHILYERFLKEFNVRKSMKVMAKYGDETSIRLSSNIFLISPRLFERAISIYCRFLYYRRGIAE